MAPGLLAYSATIAQAEDRDLTFAIGMPPIHTWSKAYTDVGDNIEERSDGALSAETHYGWLLNLKQSLSDRRDGVADAAIREPGYHPVEPSQTNLIVDLTLLDPNTIELSAAVSEYMFTCTECLAEPEEKESVFVALTAIAPYVSQTSEPLVTVGEPESQEGPLFLGLQTQSST